MTLALKSSLETNRTRKVGEVPVYCLGYPTVISDELNRHLRTWPIKRPEREIALDLTTNDCFYFEKRNMDLSSSSSTISDSSCWWDGRLDLLKSRENKWMARSEQTSCSWDCLKHLLKLHLQPSYQGRCFEDLGRWIYYNHSDHSPKDFF